MAGHDFKKTGVLRAGFQYQDLVAIEILINFYRQRDLYAWVQLEAEDSEFRSIEDVVACRPDGLYELTQVKFTVDPAVHKLNWEWLTARKDSGTSLLQKWAHTTLHHRSSKTLASAALKTDRIPDASFMACLNCNKVDYTQLSADEKTVIDEQLGSSDRAVEFFESFEFLHSQLRLDDFEAKLRSRVAPDTDSGGWFSFRNHVENWATRNRQPAPDGKIKYIHLHQAFSLKRAKPISQDFKVPSAYKVPDEIFNLKFFNEITKASGTTVLWGPPGRGKSTYLSHCFTQFNRERIVCIRHHYFLSLTDRSEGRFNFHAIARSLEHQLKDVIPNLETTNKELGEILETAASGLQVQDRLLVVIIDGLDHVWRENRDHEHMELLFDALLPLPANVRLIVGTQKIPSEHLPAKLIATHPVELWFELPLMSLSAVHKWLIFQDTAGILNLKISGRWDRVDAISEAANALHEISRGLPLHLIYSFQALMITGMSIDAHDIRALPSCPGGDIREYYSLIWNGMTPKAKLILHTLAGLKFGPPPFAMQECFGRNDESLNAFVEINHLLDYQEIEVRPFHGSLFAFVQDLPAHTSSFFANATDVLAWLESDAPAYWRWAWLWITRNQLGDPTGLLEGPDREWAIRSLVAGYPISQLADILNHAEQAAFDAFELPRFHALRSLKTRILNGPELQTDEWSLFPEVAVSLSEDPYVAALLWNDLQHKDSELFPFITRFAHERDCGARVQEAIDELNRRIEISKYDKVNRGTHYRDLGLNIVAVIANASPIQTQSVIEYAEKHDNAYSLIVAYAQACMLTRKFGNVFEVGKRYSGSQLDREVFAALCLEGLAPASIPDLKALTHPAIRCITCVKEGYCADLEIQNDLSHLFVNSEHPEPGLIHKIHDALYETFFVALVIALSDNRTEGQSTIPDDAQESWLAEVIRTLEQIAGSIASRWRIQQQWPSLKEIYIKFDLAPDFSGNYVTQQHFIGVRLVLQDIAIDLCMIGVSLDSNRLIEKIDIESVVMSPFWADEGWLEKFTKRRLVLHTPDAVQLIVDRVESNLDNTVTEFCERSNIAIKLALFACDHGLATHARKELERAINCLLGYGFHKDLYAREVLESLEALVENGDDVAKETLFRLAGEFESITEYTDGDHTDYVREIFYNFIGTYFPNYLARCYAHLIKLEEWNYAEILATAIVKSGQIHSESGEALLESFITPVEIHALTEINSDLTSNALEIVLLKTGKFNNNSDSDEVKTKPKSHSDNCLANADPKEDQAPKPCEYPPAQLSDFLEALKNSTDFERRRELLKKWLTYWVNAGHASKVLTELESIHSDGKHRFAVHEVYDQAFEIALNAQGRSKAFPWLVRAHVSSYGWNRWFTNEKAAQARFRAVALHYRQRWKEFIKETARPTFELGRNEIEVGMSRLVLFLLEIGETELARKYALEMARVFEDELTEQPIETPEWAK